LDKQIEKAWATIQRLIQYVSFLLATEILTTGTIDMTNTGTINIATSDPIIAHVHTTRTITNPIRTLDFG
jgi:hypothetical protein